MLLYHGSNKHIENINLAMCRPYKNFGEKVSLEWAAFVMNNRNRYFEDYTSDECNLDNKYDIVMAPIADDNMVMLFRQYQNGMIDFDMLVKGMAYREITRQCSFHTEKAIRLLKKVGVIDE